MSSKKKTITILGSTGSIGRSALDVVRRHADEMHVLGLAAFSNVELLSKQVEEFQPTYVAIGDVQHAARLRVSFPNITVLEGASGIEEIASLPSDITLCAIVGAAGLSPVLRVLERGGTLALANKEPMVMAGALITELARVKNAQILPVDSEHSAIFQCLKGNEKKSIHRIFLTASGGPFYGKSREDLREVTPAQAVKHPTWDMGRKISVDSATLMNKGLEIIEAMWLFNVPVDKIEVVIHPQSIVHGMVEFTDGNILAHLGPTDMRFPIEYALTWPERAATAIKRLDLAKLGTLSFYEPDFAVFPCLKYAVDAAKLGGTAPTVLNAANEVAVEAFCANRISFLQISEIVSRVMETCPYVSTITIETVLESDRKAREIASQIIETLGV